ncbi:MULTISPECIES: chemotaxis protein CheW [Alloalcanivorax]|jgi:purine-binding chemotaxis protein CheW|uniref:Chemotaxis protein CheW n=2 Tax=Alloalcanivorax TaxID=3020832 RepID=A0A9Q3ZGV9_9GAMM|nr:MULTISPECIES: chemotaxis protein CheW [Alloalcanivorax]ERS13412.1 purine-binding chemotaxis protein [Alcanivorax sp. PN-3]KYZ87396.1 chemotaxis protein CheW [Alcanivorax sp. KX64203]MBA4723254.1 chemotaxis protein CheW [Alcanivorax sp.]ARB46716.1 chemotaxis protein CheW [Alloalcanivorax xenomutans]MCE7509984.1 chemotaxis protein CheW [Alloalcanivorax xenomutans]|tara:strand:- start:1551 stop:2051 length:501 start_codon:yes stop_codon:yes gene_type:complete
MSNLVSVNPVKKAAEISSREFLVFSLGDEEYAIDILKVQEIRGYENVTRIANAPDFIKGVANLRGVIVPIVDLRLKFRLASADYTQQTVVIVINIGTRVVGIVVDQVSDVMTLTAEQIKPPPEFGISLPLDYIHGLGNLEERMLVLVDIERLLTSEELAIVERVGE